MLPLSFPPTSTASTKGYFPPPPQMISGQCKSILSGLLTKDPRRRLGYRTGAGDVRAHKWFRDINFALLRHTKPPLQPKCCDYAIHTPNSSLECSLPPYDKEARIPTDEADPFDQFCSGNKAVAVWTKFFIFIFFYSLTSFLIAVTIHWD